MGADLVDRRGPAQVAAGRVERHAGRAASRLQTSGSPSGSSPDGVVAIGLPAVTAGGGLDVMTGGRLLACVPTVRVKAWVATPPRPSSTRNLTGWSPSWAAVGSQVTSPAASMVMPAGAASSGK